jgi:hypothetical protein
MSGATSFDMIEAARKRKEEGDDEMKDLIEKINNRGPEQDTVDESDNVQAVDNEQQGTQEDQEAQSEEDPRQAAEQTSDDADGNRSLSVEERIDLMERELELRDLKIQKMESKSSKWEHLAQKRAGELDFLRKSTSRTKESADDDIWSEFATSETEQETRSGSVDLSEFEQDAIDNARQQEQLQFLNQYENDLYTGEGDERELNPTFIELLKEVRVDYEDELSGRSLKAVRKATKAILKEARLALKEKQLEGSIEEARKRRAIVSNKAREKKLSNQASESSPATQSDFNDIDIKDLSADEMAKLLRKDKRRTRYR